MDVCDCPEVIKVSEMPDMQYDGKYVQQIGMEVEDNHLTIKMEKNKKKRIKISKWEFPCDCDVVEIKRPVGDERPKIVNGGDCNQIIFETPKVQLKKSDPDMQQSLVYKIEPCGKSKDLNGQCRRITVYPGSNDSDSQEVHGDRITCGNQEIFMLRVQKKTDQTKRNVELELRTPKPPSPPPTPPPPAIPHPVNTHEHPKANKNGAHGHQKSKGKKEKKKKK